MRAVPSGEIFAPSCAVAAIAFLAVAAAGSGTAIGSVSRGASAGALVVSEWVGGLLVLGAAALAVALLLFVRPRRQKRREEENERYIEPRKVSPAWIVGLVALTVLAAAVIFVVARAVEPPPPAAQPSSGRLAPLPARSTAAPRVTPPSQQRLPRFAWGWFALAAIALLLVLCFVLMRRARRSLGFRVPRPNVKRVRVAGDDALETAAARAEPRLAVRIAYALMRRSLAARGVAADDSDAPREYAQRACSVLPDVADPIGRLSNLYERARFSTAVVDDDAKQSALVALRELRSNGPR